jgi:hypothetical protein
MQASTVVAYIGLVCSIILIIVWIAIAIIDFKSINRVTIRLVAGIAIADLLTHISSILANGTKHLVGTPYCESLAAVTALNRHLYAFTNIAICYHLYRAIIQLKKPSFKSELVVWIALVVITAILMIIYHFLGVFSGTLNKKSCNPGANNPSITKVVFGLIGLFNFISIISGIYVTVVGHMNLKLWIESFSIKEFLDPKEQEEFKAKKIRETRRFFIYPLSPLITLTAEVVLCTWMLVSDPPLIIYNVSSICTGLKGSLTLITFLLDPTTQTAIKHCISRLRSKESSNIQMNDIE